MILLDKLNTIAVSSVALAEMSDRVDYVIVGAGTAGCVLAARLSEDPDVTVALLEAGGTDSNPAIWETDLDAQRSLWAPDAKENWGYQTVPQPGLHGRAIPIARGKVLGGCSAVNAMIYIRGNRRDFDGWSQLGNRGWSYAEVLPYFEKSECYHGPASDFHGRDGPVSVIDYPNPSPAAHAFVAAAAELGHTRQYNDFNAASQEGGAGLCQSTRTPAGARVSAASAFVTPNARRGNLRVYTEARATRVLLERGRAVGVQYAARGALASIHAQREVVLCCGAFETPKLMMLSGLGPAEALARNDIRVVQDIAGVGKNLQDHLLLGVSFESKVRLPEPQLLAEASLFTWVAGASPLLPPNLQYFFVPFQFRAGEQRASGPGLSFLPILAQPRSRGSVTLASGDPAALARVDTQYLSTDEDIAALEHGVRYARELAHTRPFDTLRGRELAPGNGVVSSLELRTYIRRSATTVWHPTGTCRMGTEHDCVVDPELKVRGVEGLRIADASIMPSLISGNPNAAVMMIAEKAADLIAGRKPEVRPPRDGRGSVSDVGSVSSDAPSSAAASQAVSRPAFYRDKVTPRLEGAIAGRGRPVALYDLVAEQWTRATQGVSAAVCLATCKVFRGDEERALPSAAALEMLEEAFLTREPGPYAVTTEPGEPSRRRAPRGAMDRHVGDVMGAIGTRIARQNVRLLEPELAARVLSEFERIATEGVEGRALELGGPGEQARGGFEEHYLLTVLKQAAWRRLIGPARIGALIATPDLTDLDRFNRFGYFAALASQIREDLRQPLAGPAQPGTPARHPPRGRRMTFTLAHLMDNCDGAERAQLTGLLGGAPPSQREAASINEALRSHGSVAYARDAARLFAESARCELETAYAGAEQTPDLDFLRALADYEPGAPGSPTRHGV